MRTQSCHRFLTPSSARFFSIATILAAIAASTTAFQSRPANPIQTAPQPQSGNISLGSLFDTDLAELKPTPALTALVEKVRSQPAECSDRFTLKVVIKGVGDPIFRDTLAKARQEALELFFKSQGLTSKDYKLDVPDLNGQKDDVQASYWGPEQPQLTTTSKPAKGTKVKIGETIEVTLTAVDDANSRQSGIRAIQLVDLNINGTVPNPWYAESSGVLRCTASARRPPSLIVRYKVPPDAPPIVRLEGSAEDFVGKVDRDLGEFPLGDWYGTIKRHREIINTGYNHTITWAFEVSEMPGGQPNYAQVRGRAVGKIVHSQTSKHEECTFHHDIKPKRFEVEVTGQRLGDRLMINFPDAGVVDTVRQTCVRGYDATEPRPVVDAEAAMFDISGITAGAQYPLRSEVPPSNPNDRVTTTMQLYRAQK